MAKINASLADVSTDFQPLDAGIYILEITEVEEKEQPLIYVVKMEVAESPDHPEAIGKKFTDRIYMEKKDGTSNQFGLIQLKRYFEAVLGKENARERANDLDSDELVGGRVTIELSVESYEKDGETRYTNRTKTVQAA